MAKITVVEKQMEEHICFCLNAQVKEVDSLIVISGLCFGLNRKRKLHEVLQCKQIWQIEKDGKLQEF